MYWLHQLAVRRAMAPPKMAAPKMAAPKMAALAGDWEGKNE